ncbi:MAG: hypothetical protein O6837_12280 [Deltaproteobacteria bacterium]|nr:hypothetical protein [Deltaproteobacteria bacterium]
MVIAPLTAIGLGFLINDLILLPLVLVFLLMTLWGLHRGRSGLVPLASLQSVPYRERLQAKELSKKSTSRVRKPSLPIG